MLDSTHAAQAILDEAYRLPLQNGQPNMAAALEALADQVVPPLDRLGLMHPAARDETQAIRRDILAIAAQLRGSNSTHTHAG